MKKHPMIPRDISWLSFNARVLQEAADPRVPLKNRLHFLAIHSNNLDEFFSIRVPALNAQLTLELKKKNQSKANEIKAVLDAIFDIVIEQQASFAKIWHKIRMELKKQKILLLTEKELNKEQKQFIHTFYENEVSPNIIPLFIKNIPLLPTLWSKNTFLGVVMRSKDNTIKEKYAIIEIPTKAVGRFIVLPSPPDEQHIILLEDVVRYHLPYIFSYFGYDTFEAHLFKVAQDEDIDLDSDLDESYVEKIATGIKKRRRGKPLYFLYDQDMDAGLLTYLIRWLNLSKQDSIIPRGRIRNFRDFLKFPARMNESRAQHRPFPHPDLAHTLSVSDIVLKKDILLFTPYHSFNAIIDMLREAAMDTHVKSIKITAYRLAQHSKICNALINAARNGKKVQVILELKARFDEEANLNWKQKLEEEGVKVYVGVPNLKIHAKMCLIKKRIGHKNVHYGFIGTGNLNESTAQVYVDYFLLTSHPAIMKDVGNIFKAIQEPEKNWHHINRCKTLLVSPVSLRQQLMQKIDREMTHKAAGKRAGIKLELNSLSDEGIINKLYQAAEKGVEVKLIIRSIMCAVPTQPQFTQPLHATSIVDELLEHGRAFVFDNNGKEETFLSSADWMPRNLDYRVEVAVPLLNPIIKRQLLTVLNIKFSDNVKARILDNALSNQYVARGKTPIRSQVAIYHYLHDLAQVKKKETK